MRTIALILLFVLPVWCTAQTRHGLSQLANDSADLTVGIRGEGLVNANTLDNQFLSTFFSGDLIDAATKQRVLEWT